MSRGQRHRDRDTSLQPADRACSLLLLTADFRRLFLGYIDDGKVVAVRSKKRHAEKKCRKEIVYSSRFVRVIKCRKQKRNAETHPKRAAFRTKKVSMAKTQVSNISRARLVKLKILMQLTNQPYFISNSTRIS